MRTPSVLLASAGLVLIMAMPASADTLAQPRSSTGSHCVVTAVDISAESTASPTRCFSTSAEALAAADAGGTILGIEYDGKDFGGWSLVITADKEDACGDGHAYGVPRLPSKHDNMISSARTYAGCKAIHWSGARYKGDRIACGCSRMQAMSNRTTSILFT